MAVLLTGVSTYSEECYYDLQATHNDEELRVSIRIDSSLLTNGYSETDLRADLDALFQNARNTVEVLHPGSTSLTRHDVLEDNADTVAL